MPLDLRQRIKLLMNEQEAEAEEPASYAVLRGRSDEQPDVPDSSADTPEEAPPPESGPIESPEATDATQESIESPETPEPQSLQIDSPDEPPEPESVEISEPDQLPEPPPPEDRTVDDWEPPVEAQTETPEFGEAPESVDLGTSDETPDWESMLGYVGQQANDQLFDGIAIRLAESSHRIINRVQDKFEQHMAELDIGNSF